MPMTGLRECIAEIAERLAAAGVENARGEAWLLLGAVTGLERATLAAGALPTLGAEQEAALEALVRRRQSREPIAYILGAKEFWSLGFDVDPAVLIPRPETETVVEAVLEQIGDKTAALRILDLGTGSGCLLLALLSELPCALGLGVDDSAAALAVARRNAERLGLAARAEFRQASWGAGLQERFDLIVSNPPYVAEGDWDRPAVRDPPLRAEGGAGRRPRRARSVPRHSAGLRASLGGRWPVRARDRVRPGRRGGCVVGGTRSDRDGARTRSRRDRALPDCPGLSRQAVASRDVDGFGSAVGSQAWFTARRCAGQARANRCSQ